MVDIVVKAVIEMLGAPKEHIEKTLDIYVDKLKEDWTINSAVTHEGKEQGQLFSCFVELELVCKTPLEVLDFCFDSMPGSIDIVSPDELKLSMQDLTTFLNDLQARLHENDMILKNIQSTKKLLDQNVVNIFRNFIKFALEQGEKTLGEVGALVGVEEKDLKPFLDKMIEENILTKKGEQYCLKNEQSTQTQD